MLKVLITVTVCLPLLFSGTFLQESMMAGICPKNCPINIEEFRILQDCMHEMRCLGIIWQNNSTKTITACEIRVYFFDVLKRRSDTILAHMYKRSIAAGKKHQSPAFANNRLGGFNAYYIFALPERVLFEDGDVWQRDDDSVFKQIAERLGTDIDPAELQNVK